MAEPQPSFDVVAIGGGPAGSVAAMQVARSGRSVALVARAERYRDKIGETVAPSIRTLLERLGVLEEFLKADFLASYANRSVWGSDELLERNFISDPYGHGWHLDRKRFDALLLETAQRAGAEVLPDTAVVGHDKTDTGWRLDLRGPDRDHSIEASWVIDATGRASWFARRIGVARRGDDKLVASTGFIGPPVGSFEDTTTVVEAMPAGWWYSAPLPDGRLVAAYFTDPDLAAGETLTSPNAWLRMMSEAAETHKRVTRHGGAPPETLRVLSAGSSRLEVFVGENWLAAGDAAFCYDPLSSGGISAAMGGGMDAADTVCRTLAGDSDAVGQYTSRLHQAYERYLHMLAAYYRDEKRWPDRPFWKRRSSPPKMGEAPAA